MKGKKTEKKQKKTKNCAVRGALQPHGRTCSLSKEMKKKMLCAVLYAELFTSSSWENMFSKDTPASRKLI